ncbi:MAG TPA: prepilin-type N-terminal cleavage/methylation domain-containing protein [Pseudomonadales bacterium]|nr:prepilin-type N-terminal cleavage/methylation domain-containing protein [Pseudomonadales bacterium]
MHARNKNGRQAGRGKIRQQGFTLIELMIAAAIIAIISAIALPAYRDYIQTARTAVLAQNIDSMRLFQEDYRLRLGTYFAGEWNDTGTQTLETTLGWAPNADGSDVDYVVTATATNYTVLARDNDGGICLTRSFPDAQAGDGTVCP